MDCHWTVGKKLFTGLGALAALLLVVSGFAWWNNSESDARFDDAVRRAYNVKHSEDLDKLGLEVYAAEKIKILSVIDDDKAGFDTWNRRLTDAMASAKANAAELEKSLRNPADREQLATSKRLFDEFAANHVNVQRFLDQADYAGAQAYSRTHQRPLVDANTEALARILKSQEDQLAEANAASQAATARALWILMLLIASAVAVAAVTMMVVRQVTRQLRSTAAQLRQGAEQVVSASQQVSVSSQSLSQGATEQAASLEETSASMEEMASMTRKNAENSGEASKLMADVDRQVAASNAMLGEMVTAMGAIKDSSSRVSKIIKTIDEIAFQTNILALNAAVEAARAGEAGMGFAVVADEVRNLAQRSAQAAKDTAALIEEAGVNADQGSQKVEQVAAAIGQFTESVVRVKAIADEVSQASRQQAQGIDQVTRAISEMEKVTQTTAATAEESAAASEELNAQAEQSMTIVSGLEQLVGRDALATHAPARAHKTQAAAPKKDMRLLPSAGRKPGRSAEEQIPLGEDTGTYGRF